MTESRPIPRRVIEGHELYSTHLSEVRTVKVLLPPNYSEQLRYPVLYCHDGNEFFTHGRIATIATQLMIDGKIRPMLIVGIAVNHKFRTDDYAPDGQRQRQYLNFVVEECVPFVEQNYRVDGTGSHRFMAGVSLGAAASMELHLQYPQLFSNLLLFSGAFYETSQAHIKAQTQLQSLSAFMVVGRQETAVETTHGIYDFYEANQRTRDLLRIRDAEVDYREADGTHIWGFWQRLIPDALAWVERMCQMW